MIEEKDSLELAKVDDKVVANYRDAEGKVMGMEEYVPATTFGYLKLDNSSASDTFGMIEYTLTGEKAKSWDVILLDYGFSRILFPEGMTGSDPLCKTIKKEKNALNLEGTEYGKCAFCENSRWNGKTPPACKESINFTGLIGGEMATPFSIQFRGASYKVGTGLLNNFYKSQRPLFSSILTITTKKETKGSVAYYTLVVTEKEAISKDVMDKMAEAYLSMKDNTMSDPLDINGASEVERVADALGGTVVDEDEPFK